MKTFLIVAGLLMTGASVYGVVDYNKKADNKEFKELYKEKPAPVETELVKEEAPVPVETKAIKSEEVKKTDNVPVKKVSKKKKAKKEKEERKFRMKEFSRGKLG